MRTAARAGRKRLCTEASETNRSRDLFQNNQPLLKFGPLFARWQIDFQNTRGFGFDSMTFQRADVDKKLGLTDEQKQKLRAIQADTQKKNQAAFNPPNMYQQKIAGILSQSFKDMQPLHEQRVANRKAMKEALQAPTVDPARIEGTAPSR